MESFKTNAEEFVQDSIQHEQLQVPQPCTDAYILIKHWPDCLTACVPIGTQIAPLPSSKMSPKSILSIKSDVLKVLSYRMKSTTDRPVVVLHALDTTFADNEPLIFDTTLSASLYTGGVVCDMFIERVVSLAEYNGGVVNSYSVLLGHVKPGMPVSELAQSLTRCMRMAVYRGLKTMIIDASSFAKLTQLSNMLTALKSLGDRKEFEGHFLEVKLVATYSADFSLCYRALDIQL